MSIPDLETEKAVDRVNALIEHLSLILDMLDGLQLDRAAIEINDSIVQLASVRDSLETATDKAARTPDIMARIDRINRNLTIPRFGTFG